MTLPCPDACIASVWTSPQGPFKYAINGGNSLNAGITEMLVPNINAALGDNIAGVMALLLIWAAFEGDMVVNGHTLPIIPKPLSEHLKGIWVSMSNAPEIDPIEKISLAVQQLCDQLAIIPLVCHPVQQAKSGGTATAPEHQQKGDGAIVLGKGTVPAAISGSEDYWSCTSFAPLDVDVLF